MELSDLARGIREYRAYTGFNKSLFCKLIGTNTKALNRLENNEFLLMDTRLPFINALLKKTLHPGSVPVAACGRTLKSEAADAAFAALYVPPPFSTELCQVIETAKRYQTLILGWGKTSGRYTSAGRMNLLIAGVIEELERPRSAVPIQRHCMLMGMVQGFMIKEGVFTIEEALEDQNTLYYVDQPATKEQA